MTVCKYVCVYIYVCVGMYTCVYVFVNILGKIKNFKKN
jgi:hypothetical protein